MIKRIILFTALLTVLTVQAQATKPPYQVIAYLATTYVGSSRGFSAELLPNNVPWQYLTRLYAFTADVSAGAASYTPLSAYSNLVSTAHSHSTRIYLTVGGAGSASAFSSATSSPSNTSAFVTSIVNLVNAYGFDGVDIDWEFPTSAESGQWTLLIQDLATALHAQTAYDGTPQGVDFYGSPGYAICGFNWPQMAQYVDYVLLSGYAYQEGLGAPTTVFDGPVSVPAGNTLYNCAGVPHPFSIAGEVAELSTAPYNFPVSQMILASPLYIGNGSTDIYSVIQGGNFVNYAPLEMESVFNVGGNYYSGDDSQSFCDKISWALSKGMPGIGLFELSQACPYTDQPVTALWAAIGDTSGCVTLPTATFTSTATSTPTATNTNTPTSTNTICMVGGVPCTSTNTPTFTNTPTVTFTPTITPTVGVSHLTIYPNPTNGQPVNVQVPITSVSNVKLQVYTLGFRKVWELNYPQVAPNTPLSVSLYDKTGAAFANGLYYVVAVTSQGTYKTKLLILR